MKICVGLILCFHWGRLRIINIFHLVADSCAQSRILSVVRTEGGWEAGSVLGIIHTAVDRTSNQI